MEPLLVSVFDCRRFSSGSPLLWPDSIYNQSVRHINERFQGTDHLYVIVKGQAENTMKSPQVLETIEAFQRYMMRSPHVGGTDSLVDLTRQINSVLHNSDPRWSLLPRSADDVGGIVMVAEHGSEPGDFDRWVNYNFQHGRVTFFLYDHKGDTLRDVIDRATEFIQSHPLEDAEFKLASGYAGVFAAANEVIARSDKLTLGLMLLAQLVFCAIGFRSLVAGLFFVGVVLLSNTFGMALMAYWNVGSERQHFAGDQSGNWFWRGLRHLYRVADDRRIPTQRRANSFARSSTAWRPPARPSLHRS